MRAGNKGVIRIDVWKHVASRQRAMRQFNTIKQKAEEASGEGAYRSLIHSLFLTEAPARKKCLWICMSENLFIAHSPQMSQKT